jgi:hypothetical protein
VMMREPTDPKKLLTVKSSSFICKSSKIDFTTSELKKARVRGKNVTLEL